MKVLVTGGTGFVGKKLVHRLVAQGHNVIVFAKDEETSSYPARPDGSVPLTYIRGDIRKLEELRKAFPVDFVYHLAAGMGESKEDAEINVEGTRNVVRMWEEARFYQVIYLSSSGVLGETKEPAKEDDPYNPGTRYEKSKRDAEQIIKSRPLSYTIVRAPIIIGANTIWKQILGAAKRGYPIVGSGKNSFHLAAINDVVEMLLMVMRNDKAVNQTFNVATKDVLTYEETYKNICEILEVPLTKKHVSPAVAKLGMRIKSVFRKSSDVTGSAPSIDRLVRNRVIDVTKAKEVLGFVPQYDTRNALKETIEEMKNGGHI